MHHTYIFDHDIQVFDDVIILVDDVIKRFIASDPTDYLTILDRFHVNNHYIYFLLSKQ